jgi:class 3 adenylate cyclase
VVKLMGDGILVEFPSVVEAVQCAVDVQRAMAERNDTVPSREPLNDLKLHIGFNDSA